MLHSGNDKRRKDTIAMDVKKVLERVSSGVMDVAEAEALLRIFPMRIWDMPNWIITGSCVPGLERPCSVRESRIRIWWRL